MFKIGSYYKNRRGRVFKRIAHWCSLPVFVGKWGRQIIRNPAGMYRWDGIETEDDIIPVEVV